MDYIKLENMNLSRIVLGTDGYSERISEKDAFEIMDCYIENKGNVIDTARMYCNGESEKTIGKFIKSRSEKIYISSKCAHPPVHDMSCHRLKEADIEYDIDTSLKAIGVEQIDIMWLHRDDLRVNVKYIIDVMNKMIKKGKITHFGASNWRFDRIAEANAYAEKNGCRGFIASQPLYNMATRSYNWDETLVCLEGDEKGKYDKSHFPVFAFSSQAKGFFEKYYEEKLSEKAKDRYLNEHTLKTCSEIYERSRLTGESISHTALSMLTEQSDFPLLSIIGPSDVSQLKLTLNI